MENKMASAIDKHIKQMGLVGILQLIGLNYDDACSCKNCERLCNIIDEGF